MIHTISRHASLLAILFVMLNGNVHAAETYALDTNHTNIVWSINHFGFSNPSGKFTKVEGQLVLDEANPANSKVSMTLSPANILTGIDKLDEHLKSKDFFDVEQFPNATFVSTKVALTGKDTAKVTGTLTLHGISKPVTLDVKLNKIGVNMFNKKTAGFSAFTTIKRSDFGINTYLPALVDDVKISIESEANIAS